MVSGGTFHDEATGIEFSYGPEGLQKVQGRLLHATIKYLETTPNTEALDLLRSWVRQQNADKSAMYAHIWPTPSFITPQAKAGEIHSISDYLNLPFYVDKVEEHDTCPSSLAALGLEGLYVLLKQGSNAGEFEMSYEEARAMVGLLDTVDEYCAWEEVDVGVEVVDGVDPVEALKGEGHVGERLRRVFVACQEGSKIIDVD